MITATDLFGRPCITKNERQALDAARRTAMSIYEQRNQEPYVEHFGNDADLTDVEQYLITVLKVKDAIKSIQTEFIAN